MEISQVWVRLECYSHEIKGKTSYLDSDEMEIAHQSTGSRVTVYIINVPVEETESVWFLFGYTCNGHADPEIEAQRECRIVTLSVTINPTEQHLVPLRAQLCDWIHDDQSQLIWSRMFAIFSLWPSYYLGFYAVYCKGPLDRWMSRIPHITADHWVIVRNSDSDGICSSRNLHCERRFFQLNRWTLYLDKQLMWLHVH